MISLLLICVSIHNAPFPVNNCFKIFSPARNHCVYQHLRTFPTARATLFFAA